MELGDRIRALMAERGLNETQLARRAGVSQPTINDLINGKQRTTKFIAEIAAALGVPATELNPKLAAGFVPPPVLLGERTLPVYSAAEGGPGELVVSTEPLEWVPRPWYLGEVRDGFAVLVVGESMSPAFEPGDMAVINPRLPPVRNKTHIFTSGEAGEFAATIKRLIGQTATEWKVQQFNPKHEFGLKRAKWPRALRVVGKYES